ncbi:MAG: acetolactate decarboxylase [Methanocorpusculum sp.]|nr:acetolactate decarboxylase [Methanocorpusculum sp.]
MKKPVTHPLSSAESCTLYQVSLLSGLVLGDFCGHLPLSVLKTHGDTGLGTFDGADGELIMLDGAVFRAAADGTIEQPRDTETTPFAAAVFFKPDFTADGIGAASLQELEERLFLLTAEDKNSILMLRLEGFFPSITLRSIVKQKKSGVPLAEVLKTGQRVYTFTGCTGTLVGLCCPEYMGGINAPGWHFHFISADKTKGGHLLDCTLENGSAVFCRIESFSLQLPQSRSSDSSIFRYLDFSKDTADDLRAVEGKKEQKHPAEQLTGEQQTGENTGA